MPVFKSPVYFKQEAGLIKLEALVTPYSTDRVDDGDEDLICGNSAGYIGFIENLDGGDLPEWNSPELLKADGKVTWHFLNVFQRMESSFSLRENVFSEIQIWIKELVI